MEDRTLLINIYLEYMQFGELREDTLSVLAELSTDNELHYN